MIFWLLDVISVDFCIFPRLWIETAIWGHKSISLCYIYSHITNNPVEFNSSYNHEEIVTEKEPAGPFQEQPVHPNPVRSPLLCL